MAKSDVQTSQKQSINVCLSVGSDHTCCGPANGVPSSSNSQLMLNSELRTCTEGLMRPLRTSFRASLVYKNREVPGAT